MIELSTWFKRSTQTPILSAVGLIVALWLGYGATTFLSVITNQKTSIDQLSSLTSLAMSQKNRTLIESLLDVARAQLGATSAFVCENGQVAVAVNYQFVNCDRDEGLFQYSFKRNISGFSGARLIFIYSIPALVLPIILNFLIGLSVVAFCWRILAGVQYRLKTDILLPLSNGLLSDGALGIQELEDIRSRQNEAAKTKTKEAVSRAILEHNVQIAHDIRSPLSALNIAVQTLKITDVDRRELISAAIGRIDGIAAQLLGKESLNKHDKMPMDLSGFTGQKFVMCRVAELANAAIREAAIQLPEDCRIRVDADFTDDFEYQELSLPSDAIKRIISNLLNNGIEAVGTEGYVQVIGRIFCGSVSLEVRDNGCGIPSEILDQVGQRGFSTKIGSARFGSGLGLCSAKQTVASLGGTLKIESQPGKGTSVRISLPNPSQIETRTPTTIENHFQLTKL